MHVIFFDKKISEVEELLDKGHFFILDTHNSEDLASFAHFFLTVTPY